MGKKDRSSQGTELHKPSAIDIAHAPKVLEKKCH